MCNFLSGIVMRNGDLLWNPYTDSHEDLIALNNLRDTREGAFVRVEFSPPSTEDLAKPATYKLKVDQDTRPAWFTPARLDKAADKMRSIVKRMIVDRPVVGLCGGSYILAAGANVSWVKAVRIIAVCDSARIGRVFDSARIESVCGSARIVQDLRVK